MPSVLFRARGVRVFATAAVLASVAVVTDPGAHAAVAAIGAQSARAARPLSLQQALAQAASSGHAVPVPSATTPTQTLAANPDGTLTLDQSAVPVRKQVGGTWHALDATLRRTSDGTVSTSTTTSALTLSDGGNGPLATMSPTFEPPAAGSSANGWTTVNTAFPGRSYWDTTGLLQVGEQARSFPHFVARSFVNLPVPSQIYGATIISAQLNLTEEWSASCTATPVQAWSTGAVSPSTTWNHQPAWKSEAGSQTVAHGYSSACPAAGVGFNVQKTIQSAASQQWSQATFGLRAADESDPDGWKQFANTATLSITYDHPPGAPTGLSTSPATACPAATPTIVGDGNVSLNVPASDPDGGTLGVTIDMWNTATGAAFTGTPTNPQLLYVSSGSTAVFIAHQADLEAAAAGAVTEFSWKAQVTDYDESSPWSATCSFYFDPTHPAAPVVTAPAATTVGQPATFTVAPPASGPVPAGYSYQLNVTAPATVTATSSGDASITIVPTSSANTLTVTSLSAGGNRGGTATVAFNAAPAAPAADSDLTGDGKADLLTVGSSANGLPPGLWLAPGLGNGQVQTAVTDIGVNGNGTGSGSPTDFNGAQVITGHFGGTGLQDVLAYYPANFDQANILFGNGTGAPLQAQVSGNEVTLSGGTFSDLNGDNPLQLANAGDTSGGGYAYPDLIAINGDSANGYYLEFYPDGDGIGSYFQADPLTTLTPTGGTDWNNWTMATAQLSSGTAMYLWDSSTGALYLWENLAYNMNTGAFSYTQYVIANGSSTTWNKGATLTLQAADVNGDGTPDLWTVGAGAAVTAYLATLGSGTATLAAQPTQVITP